jgi:hypothetical protein
MFRHEIIKFAKKDGVGIELGVAQGEFAERILKTNHLKQFYGVDKYNDHHNESEYRKTLKRLEPYTEYTKYQLHRMTFSDALELFPNDHFDFIYIDGYAHTGEDGGKTFYDWYPKAKSGCVFGGDDYHKRWPKVIKNVDQFCKEFDLQLNVVDCSERTTWSQFPTWYIIKP